MNRLRPAAGSQQVVKLQVCTEHFVVTSCIQCVGYLYSWGYHCFSILLGQCKDDSAYLAVRQTSDLGE